MKKIIRYGFFILFSILFCNGICTGPEAHAAPKYKDMHCEKEVTTKTDVKIKWRKQKNTSGYLVYRSLQLKEDTWSKAKKIATLPSDKTSLSDKTEYKKTYKYEIISYTKKGKKIKKEFTDYFFVYMGVGQADWTEYFNCEAVTTPDSIELQYAGNYYGMMPDTYEIYRSKTKKNFKKIASVKEAVYKNLIEEILWDLESSLDIAHKAGIADDRIIIDPGVGFGKSYENNLEIIDRIQNFHSLGYPLLLGASRKSVVGMGLDLPVAERMEGTLVTTVYGVKKGH